MKTGPMAEVVYIWTCLSQSGLSKVSNPKYPAEMMAVEILVEVGSCETSLWPISGLDASTSVNQVISESFEGVVEDLVVPNTWWDGLREYRAPRDAPRPRVAPTMRMWLPMVEGLAMANYEDRVKF